MKPLWAPISSLLREIKIKYTFIMSEVDIVELGNILNCVQVWLFHQNLSWIPTPWHHVLQMPCSHVVVKQEVHISSY